MNMATGTSSNNREFLFRLQILIIDGGTDVLRNTFDQKLHNVPLHVFLANEKTSINRLRGQKTVTRTQYDKLYPPGGHKPSIANFDITLIVCLLRSLPSLGLNPRYPWNVLPPPTDTSVEADLCRLKEARNDVAHISSTTGFDQTKFQTKWTEIEQVLLRLNSALPSSDPNLKQTIDSYKHSALDPVAERRIQAEIEKWQKMDIGLETEMRLIKKEVTEVRQDIKDVIGDVKKFEELLKEQNQTIKANTMKATPEAEVQKKPSKIRRALKNIFSLGKSNRQKEQQLPEIPVPVTQPNDDYLLLKKHLKDDLIEFYRRQHATIHLSPLIEVDSPLLEFYVMPNLNSVKVQWALGGGREVKTPVTQFRNVFCKENTYFSEIYLTADAGLGKTSFAKRLTLTWCHAMEPITDEKEHFSQDEIDAMSEFDFVFLLLLRDSSRECDVDDLILKHIVSALAHTSYTLKDLENILFKERCLVILDGLDEWTHPSNYCQRGWSYIPHRKARDCTILTTTRPWKLSVIDLKSSQIDQKLEIAGLSQESANTIKRAVISHICREKDKDKIEECLLNFTKALQEKEMSDLESIPLLLMFLLCLWCDKIELGETQCELYSNIIELLFTRTVKKSKDIPQVAEHALGDIPKCFSKRKRCTQFYTLLTSLAQLAFDTICSGARENILVFDNEIAKQYLNRELLKFCLQSGILTRSKIEGKLTEQEAKISFAHKTVQEFFAALHMHSAIDKTAVVNEFLCQFNSIYDILEMSKVVIFLSGINADISSLMSCELIEIINKEEITRQYRTMTHVYYISKEEKPLKESQNMYISCMKENKHNADLKLFCQDIFIDKDCQQEKYYKQLQQLAVQNIGNIKSVSIKMEGISHSVEEINNDFKLTDLSNVDRIYFRGAFDNCDITPLLHGSVKCLSLISHKWQDNHFINERSALSPSVSGRFYSLVNLEAIFIDCFEMSHDQFENLVKHLASRSSMREIVLWNLSCTDHKDSCTGFSLDLSQHSQLRKLALYRVPLSELNIYASSLEECLVGHLSTPGLVSRFLSFLPAASKLHTFICNGLESLEDINPMLDTLSSLVHVKNIRLWEINLGNKALTLSSQMINIELVVLFEAKMSASALRDLVNVVHTLPQTVTVYMTCCKVTPEEEFETVKEQIKASQHYVVTLDGINQFSDYAFVFTTIKDGA